MLPTHVDPSRRGRAIMVKTVKEFPADVGHMWPTPIASIAEKKENHLSAPA